MTTTERAVLISGCSSGIGYSAALTLKQRGYRVFATARQAEDLARLSEQGLESIALDLSDDNSVKDCFAEVSEKTQGRLYALVNNGAYGQGGALEDVSRQQLRAQFETNLFGWHDLSRRALAVMRGHGEGRIVLIGSIVGYLALPLRGAYNASKYALEGWADTLRRELGNSGIQVSLIEPGPIDTHFRANSLAQFKKTIRVDNSVHSHAYRSFLQRLEPDAAPTPFTLPPSAVVHKLVHALESRRPKTRYRVTVPAQACWFLRKIISDRMQDRIIGWTKV